MQRQEQTEKMAQTLQVITRRETAGQVRHPLSRLPHRPPEQEGLVGVAAAAVVVVAQTVMETRQEPREMVVSGASLAPLETERPERCLS